MVFLLATECTIFASSSYHTFDVKVDVLEGEMGYYHVHGLHGMHPTIGMEANREYTFQQVHYTNW